MDLDEKIQSNLVFKAYKSGHMIYTKTAARESFYRDAKAFFEDRFDS
jgi:hypothetical protein